MGKGYLQQSVLGLEEAEHPGVALHRALLALQRDALLAEQVEALRLHLGDDVGRRPRTGRHGPVGGRTRPETAASKCCNAVRRKRVHYKSVLNASIARESLGAFNN